MAFAVRRFALSAFVAIAALTSKAASEPGPFFGGLVTPFGTATLGTAVVTPAGAALGLLGGGLALGKYSAARYTFVHAPKQLPSLDRLKSKNLFPGATALAAAAISDRRRFGRQRFVHLNR